MANYETDTEKCLFFFLKKCQKNLVVSFFCCIFVIEKETNNIMKHSKKDYQNLEKKYDFIMEILTEDQLEEFETFCKENNL